MPETHFSENQILRLLGRRFQVCARGVVAGIGDDAAVILPRGAAEYWVITTDMLVEGVDFSREWLTPAELGHKALAVNLSDLAAMGVRPRFYLVALGLPAPVSRSWIDALYRGMTGLGTRYQAALIGGDLSRSEGGIVITVAALGESAGRRVLRRSGGGPGDLLYVTGSLGKAAAGLRLLARGVTRARAAPERQALRAHRVPEPRCEAGAWLARSGLVHCAMDLSDGLSVDLPRLCAASGTGAEIDAPSLPLFATARRFGADPLALALDGGEDFELLFAVPPTRAARLEGTYPPHLPPITRVGKLTRRRGIRLLNAGGRGSQRLLPRGFDHFPR